MQTVLDENSSLEPQVCGWNRRIGRWAGPASTHVWSEHPDVSIHAGPETGPG